MKISLAKKRALVLVSCFALVFNIIVAPLKVFAGGPLEVTFSQGAVSISGNEISYTVGEETVIATLDGNYAISGGTLSLGDSDDFAAAITLSDNFDSDTMRARVTGENNFSGDFIVTNGALSPDFAGYPSNVDFVVEPKSNPGPDPDPASSFDGTAYFVWKCGNTDNICYHKFTDIPGREVLNDNNSNPVLDDEGNPYQYYQVKYIPLSAVTDQSANNVAFSWDQWTNGTANWVLSSDIEDGQGAVRTDLTAAYIFGDEADPFDMGVQLNPTNARDGGNTISTNGDMNFRATIYRNGYEGVSFNASPADYTYFPGFWNPLFFDNTIDVSGTSIDNPATYETYLEEPEISFSTANFSTSQITSVEALDVPANAVNITKNGDTFSIAFNSNFYDHVKFALTSATSEVYYVEIDRVAVQTYDDLGPSNTSDDVTVTAVVFYPNTYTNDDFDVIATITKSDGSKEVKTATPTTVDNSGEYLVIGGKGLSASAYKVTAKKSTTSEVSFIVVYKDALVGDYYNGTFSGSGKGYSWHRRV